MHVWRAQGWFVNMFEIESNDNANSKVEFATWTDGQFKSLLQQPTMNLLEDTDGGCLVSSLAGVGAPHQCPLGKLAVLCCLLFMLIYAQY